MSEIIFPEYHEEGMGCGLEDQRPRTQTRSIKAGMREVEGRHR